MEEHLKALEGVVARLETLTGAKKEESPTKVTMITKVRLCCMSIKFKPFQQWFSYSEKTPPGALKCHFSSKPIFIIACPLFSSKLIFRFLLPLVKIALPLVKIQNCSPTCPYSKLQAGEMEVGKLVAKLGEITTRIENKAVWFEMSGEIHRQCPLM